MFWGLLALGRVLRQAGLPPKALQTQTKPDNLPEHQSLEDGWPLTCKTGFN